MFAHGNAQGGRPGCILNGCWHFRAVKVPAKPHAFLPKSVDRMVKMLERDVKRYFAVKLTIRGQEGRV